MEWDFSIFKSDSINESSISSAIKSELALETESAISSETGAELESELLISKSIAESWLTWIESSKSVPTSPANEEGMIKKSIKKMLKTSIIFEFFIISPFFNDKGI